MITKYGIPQQQLDVIIERDTDCVYCHKVMILPYDPANRAASATIEHLNHRADWNSVEDFVSQGQPVYPIIALCCGACNSSRGSKPLLEWFQTDYCKRWNISQTTAAPVVRSYIQQYEQTKAT